MTILELINGIQQVMSKAHDGALDDDGKPVKIGLRREKGHPLLDSRVMDGFNIHFEGCCLRIVYQSEYTLKELHRPGFESDIEDTFAKISSFIKKEFKKITGKNLTLKELGDCTTDVRTLSALRTWVEAEKKYEIGGMEKKGVVPVPHARKPNLNESLKNWIQYFRQGDEKFK